MKKVNFLRSVNWMDVSTLILIALFSVLLFSYFTFLLGFGINFLTVLVVFISLAFAMKWGKMSWQTVAAFLLLILGSTGVSLYFFDLSDDGMFYHQDMILAVKQGWNPIWETFDDPFRSSIYVQHYSKGKEILHAFIYFLTGRMESGKALNFLMAAACFIFSFRLLIGYFKKRQSLFFASLITLSPTVVTQLMTTYIDGFAYNLWIVFFVSICFYLKKSNERNAMYVIVSAVIFSTLKFTSLPVLGLTVVFTGIYLLLQKKKLPKNIFKVATLITVLGLFVNINPYVTNLAGGKSIFYPAYGKDMNILDYHLPKEMGEKSNISKFFISIFYETDKPYKDYREGMKIPFTFKFSEIKNMAYTTGLGGFGVFFGGIMILSVFLLGFSLLSSKSPIQTPILLTLCGILVYAAILPASWMARIIPYAYLIPILILLLYFSSGKKHRFTKIPAYLISFFLVLNLLIFMAVGFLYNFYYSMENHYFLNELKKEDKTYCVDYAAYKSNLIRLDERGIKYEKCDLLDDPDVLFFPPANKELSTRVKTDLKSEPGGVLGVLRRTIGKFQVEE